MIIPWKELPPDTLENIIKEYIYRELEDHQLDSNGMELWTQQLKDRLLEEEIVIEWSELTQSINLVNIEKYR